MSGSIHATLSWLTVGAATIGAATLMALVGITSVLHLVSKDLATAVESVRVADDVEVQLLTHHEARAPVTQGVAKAELLRAVEAASGFVQSDEERRRVAELREAVDNYLRPGAGDAEVSAGLTAAHRLSLINVEQARRSLERAALWDRLANSWGGAAALLHVVGLVILLIWLRRGPLRAIGALSHAMDRFHAGDLESRAPERGPAELVAMAVSFNAAADALVRARQRQAEYVATAIHDLRTPLTAIQLAVAYLAPGRPLPPEPRIRELVGLIGRQLTRLNGLTGDILSAIWIEEGELVLLREDFNLCQLASDSADMFRSLAPEHIIDVAMPSEPLVYFGDRERLAQVLNNLLSNAVKYSPRGSRVRVCLSTDGERAALSVTDEGQGIAPEDRERIFEKFQRHSATHEEAPGTSLGLWVARRVVEAHGGQMELESRVGQGSTFRIVVPLASLQPREVSEAWSLVPLGGS